GERVARSLEMLEHLERTNAFERTIFEREVVGRGAAKREVLPFTPIPLLLQPLVPDVDADRLCTCQLSQPLRHDTLAAAHVEKRGRACLAYQCVDFSHEPRE